MPRIRKDKMARSYAEPFWKIGLYIRLSREDDNEDESESVINQEKILRDFVDSYFEPGTYVIVDVFADDGLTGTDTARPNFKRLEGCIVRKEVNCMIIKSLARGFRNLADQQKFLEEFIPIHGARFICTGTPFIDTYANPHSASGRSGYRDSGIHRYYREGTERPRLPGRQAVEDHIHDGVPAVFRRGSCT